MLANYFADKHKLVVGELSLGTLQKKLKSKLREGFRISGRSLITGKKKTITICLADIVGLKKELI
ncbi:MAG: hypothetical protein DRP69_01880 [Candidatus Duberdicusella sinuisediminis]|nr:MAG: hypothetical protein DRP69_01880 [Candidatus Omnitrophota bacterium]